jgi:citrate synthase
MSTATESTAATAGLRGVVAAQSAIGDVNGEKGILIYQGYDIHDLAEIRRLKKSFFALERTPAEFGRTRRFETAVSGELRSAVEVIEMMRTFPKDADPMDVLAHGGFGARFLRQSRTRNRPRKRRQYGNQTDRADRHDCCRVGANSFRQRSSSRRINRLSIAENFLYMLRGEKAEADEAHISMSL